MKGISNVDSRFCGVTRWPRGQARSRVPGAGPEPLKVLLALRSPRPNPAPQLSAARPHGDPRHIPPPRLRSSFPGRSERPVPVVEFFIEVGVAGTYVELHEAGGPAVILYALTGVETVPERGRKPCLKRRLSREQPRVLRRPVKRLWHDARIKRGASAFQKTESQMLVRRPCRIQLPIR